MSEKPFVLKVLIIEDTPSHVQMIRHMIDRLGYEYEMTHFPSGRPALEYLDSRSPDGCKSLPNLIIADLRLDRESGLELLKKIKQNPALKGIPAILNSSYAEADDIREAYKLEGTFFISKDYDLQALEDAIQQLKIWGRLNVS